MSWIAVAAVTVTAVGAGVSAAGAAKNAKAQAKANAQNAKNEDALYERQNKNLEDLITEKNDKLKNLGGIFDRQTSTGAFGDTDTLKNLRQAQADFSALAAGDFSGFESQLRKSLSDSLISTVGSGSPIGTYAGLAADTQMAYRKEGISTALGITEVLSNESYKLLGQEFGIMDQKFNTGYQMDANRVGKVAQYRIGEAATQGVGQVAYGNAIQQVGSAIGSYGAKSQTSGMQTQQFSQAPRAVNIETQQPYAYAAQPSSYAKTSYTSPSGGYNNSSSVAPFDNTQAGTILPGDAGYDSFGSDFDYSAPSYIPNYNNYSTGGGYYQSQQYTPNVNYESGMVLPDKLTYNTYGGALASVGAKIAAA